MNKQYIPTRDEVGYIRHVLSRLDKIVADTTSDKNEYPQIIREGVDCIRGFIHGLLSISSSNRIKLNNAVTVTGREMINCIGSQCEIMLHDFLDSNGMVCCACDNKRCKDHEHKPDSSIFSLINMCLKILNFDDKEQKKWKDFLHGFRVLRNKASHGAKYPFSTKERQSLIRGGLKGMLNTDNTINFMHLDFIPSTVEYLIQFSNVLLKFDQDRIC